MTIYILISVVVLLAINYTYISYKIDGPHWPAHFYMHVHTYMYRTISNNICNYVTGSEKATQISYVRTYTYSYLLFFMFYSKSGNSLLIYVI